MIKLKTILFLFEKLNFIGIKLAKLNSIQPPKQKYTCICHKEKNAK